MKTKIIISAMFFSLHTYYSFSQIEKEKENIWQVGVNVNTVEPASDAGFDYNALSERIFINGHKKDKSYCVGINISYKIKENCALRLSAKITNYKITETRDFREFVPSPQMTGEYALDTMDIKQTMFTVSPSILWDFSYKKINFYGGFQFVYRKYSSIIGNTSYTENDYPSNITHNYTKFYQTEPGGFSFGIGPVAGFSVNVLKKLSIGAEFSTAYSYYKTGGAITTTKTNILPTYADAGTSISGQTYQGFRFSSLLSTINVSINF